MSRAAIALLCASVAALVRVPLLWDDPWAPGYDGWYYVLQVRSLLEGAPLFADRSLLFVPLTALAALLGDAVLANKVAACLFAAIGAAGATVGAHRWTGSRPGALAAGLWWALAPGHLVVSMEFLKNAAGVALVGLLLAALPGLSNPSSPGWRRDAAAVVGLVLLGTLVHKLTGLLGLLLSLGVAAPTIASRLCRRPHRFLWLAAAALALALFATIGLLRGVDLERIWSPQPGDGPRLPLLMSSRRIPAGHRIALLAAHALPPALVVASWRRPALRPLGLPLAALALATTAPFLPFGFDLTAWRLLLLSFLPMSLALAALMARAHWSLGTLLLGFALTTTPSTIQHIARAEPDYTAWAAWVPTLQAHISPESRVVAHRGLCGFVWAVADRACENFDPQGSAEGWWRIAYGMGAARLAPYSDPPPIPLMLGYTLIPEEAWRRFRTDHADALPLVRHPRNPHRPRPGFVYGPEAPASPEHRRPESP